MIRRLLTMLLSILMLTGVFDPAQEITVYDEDYVTLEETALMASELYSDLTGDRVSFKRTASGYKKAETYAKDHGFLSSLPDESYMKHKIARSEFVYIIYSASSSLEFDQINKVLEYQIFDVHPCRYYAEAVYCFAKAGIITTDDGDFRPDDNLTVYEAKEIIARITDKTLRVKQEYTGKWDFSDCIVADDTFYVSPVGYTRFTNVYVSTAYDDGYIQVQCSDNSVVSTGIRGWYDEHNAQLYIAAKEEGVVTITLTSKDLDGNVLARDELKMTVEGVYDNTTNAKIILSESSVTVGQLQTKKVKIAFDIPEGECDNPMFSFTIADPGSIYADWGEWDSYTSTNMSIQGLKEGETTIYVELFDEETGCYITGESIKVTVTDKVYVEINDNPKMG